MFMAETITFNTRSEQMHSSLAPFRHHIMTDFEEALAAIQQETKEPISLYLPEPQGIKLQSRCYAYHPSREMHG